MHLFSSMWAYGHHFRTENANDGNMTQHCGVEGAFDKSSWAIDCDQNLVRGTLGYVKKIQWTIEVDLSSL